MTGPRWELGEVLKLESWKAGKSESWKVGKLGSWEVRELTGRRWELGESPTVGKLGSPRVDG
ncbi:MAG: hypothetical protein P5687_16400 [Limnospira sp. PMC 1042.18]|nr:hypothetical protein [Limnospira sp. PMC 1042.18]